MLKESFMSVWPNTTAVGAALEGRDGLLVCISISVQPRYLEALLEALANVPFPVNPQIYHNAAVVYVYADGREEAQSTTLVEFPAYAGQLSQVRQALNAYRLDEESIHVAAMLDDIHSQRLPEPGPPGAPYVGRYRLKSRTATAAR